MLVVKIKGKMLLLGHSQHLNGMYMGNAIQHMHPLSYTPHALVDQEKHFLIPSLFDSWPDGQLPASVPEESVLEFECPCCKKQMSIPLTLLKNNRTSLGAEATVECRKDGHFTTRVEPIPLPPPTGPFNIVIK